jgi:3-phosphoshikimate 1-carboxyvinyltransferase
MTDVTFQVFPDGKLHGHCRVAGDKSISHRAIMLGAIAEGETYISGFLQGEDTLATLAAFQAMGVNIQRNQDVVKIQGVGLYGLQKPFEPVYLGNSGTSMRLLSGLLSAQDFDTVLTGDPSLSKRPMRRVTDPLSKMGAKITASENGTPPLQIFGNQKLQGIEYVMPMASAQVKSSILLAGLYAEGTTCVIEPAPTRDHSERMLQGFGYEIQRHGAQVCLKGGGKLFAKNIDVPADISSAAFFLVGAAISTNSELYIEHVGINPTRTGILNILNLMGANIQILNKREIGGEPVADLLVKSSTLKGIQIPEELVPLAIDEFPAIFIAAACADGETVLTGAEELRVKESDRIQVMADGLNALGIDAQPTPDGMIIRGGQFDGGEIDSHGDHRIAMSFAMASLRAKNPIKIKDCANVATSFPDFVELASRLGLNIEQH